MPGASAAPSRPPRQSIGGTSAFFGTSRARAPVSWWETTSKSPSMLSWCFSQKRANAGEGHWPKGRSGRQGPAGAVVAQPLEADHVILVEPGVGVEREALDEGSPAARAPGGRRGPVPGHPDDGERFHLGVGRPRQGVQAQLRLIHLEDGLGGRGKRGQPADRRGPLFASRAV